MGHSLLDEHTADRLLSGVLAPEDAPPGYAGVAALLKAASRPPTPQETARCALTVAAMSAAIAGNGHAVAPPVQTRRRAGLTRLLRPRIAATLTAGALALFGSLGAAGALPGPLQHAAHVAFGAIGISVPDSDGSDGTTAVAAHGPAETPVGPTHQITTAWPRTGPSRTGHPTTPATKSHRHDGGSGGQGARHHRPEHQARHHHDRHHAETGTHEGSGGDDPSASGPGGLCNAWSRGNGSQHGKRLSATSFERLKALAEQHHESVESYCRHLGQGSGPDGSGPKTSGGDGSGKSKSEQKNDGSGSEHPDADNSGHGGSHGGGNHGGSTARGSRVGHSKHHHSHDSPPGDAGT